MGCKMIGLNRLRASKETGILRVMEDQLKAINSETLSGDVCAVHVPTLQKITEGFKGNDHF